jgi:hypothetical protein
MRLPAPFIKLPLRFDTTRLRAEIAKFPESEWRAHPQGYAGNSALILVSHEGEENDDTSGRMAPAPRLAQCPYLRQVMGSFQAVLGRSRLMRLEPGAEVTPHADIDYYWRERIRIHVPIVTDPSVRFNCDGTEIHMAEGEAWIFDNWRPHNVINRSGIRRVHLVIDTVGSAAFWRLASGAAVASAGAAPPVRLLEYKEDVEEELAFERTNTAPLAHPAMVRSTIYELVGDLRGAQPYSQQHAQLESALMDFSNEWQALWARYADSPAAYAHFALLIEDTLKQAGQLGRSLQLPSNGTQVNMVLQRFLPAMFDDLQAWTKTAPIPRFERPVIIVSAPRSGSTLLFETLKRHPGLWTLGDEAHVEVENIPGLALRDHGFASNALSVVDLTPDVRSQLLRNFSLQLRDVMGRRWLNLDAARPDSVRLLEKTPKNALRIPFLSAMFPDARFIFLYRDSAENLGSILDAWQSGRFVTYPELPGWSGSPWSLLLPPGWQALNSRPLAEVALHQWQSANQAILDALSALPRERWRVLDYATLVQDPVKVFQRACRFMDLEPAQRIEAELSEHGLPRSRYTLTPPAKDKWRRHAEALQPVLEGTAAIMGQLSALDNRLL